MDIEKSFKMKIDDALSGFCAPLQDFALLQSQLMRHLQCWEGSRKMVYVLGNHYEESELSFENLKSEDKLIADVLREASRVCTLNLILSLLEVTDGGSSSPVTCKLTSQIPDSNAEAEWLPLTVDLEKELIPIDRLGFLNGTIFAAIAFWPKMITLDVLINSNADRDLIDKMFISEAGKCFESESAETSKGRIYEAAKFVSMRKQQNASKQLAIAQIIVKFKNIDLIRTLLENEVTTAPEAFQLIVNECDQFGWQFFILPIHSFFSQLQYEEAVDKLYVFFGQGNMNSEKNRIFVSIVYRIVAKGYSVPSAQINQRKESASLVEPLLNAVLQSGDRELMWYFIKFVVPFRPETMGLVNMVGEKIGWILLLRNVVVSKLHISAKREHVLCLTSLIKNGVLSKCKREFCHRLFRCWFEQDKSPGRRLCSIDGHDTITTDDEVQRKNEEKELLEHLVAAASISNDVSMMKSIFEQVTLQSDTIKILATQSQIFGWNTFTDAMATQFKRLSLSDAIALFSVLIECGDFKNENVCRVLFQTILDKAKLKIPPNGTVIEKEQNFLYSICRLAEDIRFSLQTFAKTQPYRLFVPVLFRFVPEDTGRLVPFWGTVALHFISVLETMTNRPIEISWRYNVRLDCRCDDCESLFGNFLRSDKESESFKIGEWRRSHLEGRANLLGRIVCRTERGGYRKVGALIVTKTEMWGIKETAEQMFWKNELAKLRSTMPPVL